MSVRYRSISALTIRKALDVVVHVDVVHPAVVLQQRELVGHADDGAAQLAVHHLEVLAPEVLELLQHLR